MAGRIGFTSSEPEHEYHAEPEVVPLSADNPEHWNYEYWDEEE